MSFRFLTGAEGATRQKIRDMNMFLRMLRKIYNADITSNAISDSIIRIHKELRKAKDDKKYQERKT